MTLTTAPVILSLDEPLLATARRHLSDALATTHGRDAEELTPDDVCRLRVAMYDAVDTIDAIRLSEDLPPHGDWQDRFTAPHRFFGVILGALIDDTRSMLDSQERHGPTALCSQLIGSNRAAHAALRRDAGMPHEPIYRSGCAWSNRLGRWL